MNERIRLSAENTGREKEILARVSSDEMSLFDLPISTSTQEIKSVTTSENSARLADSEVRFEASQKNIPRGIKYLPEEPIPPLPRNGYLNNLFRVTGYLSEFSRSAVKILFHSLAALKEVVLASTVSIAAGLVFVGKDVMLGLTPFAVASMPFSLPVFLGSVIVGVIVGIAWYRNSLENSRLGFGPHTMIKSSRANEVQAPSNSGNYAKDSEKDNPGFYYLSEKPAKKRHIKKVIHRIAELKTVNQMKKITGNPDYKIAEGTGGHCAVIGGKIYVVLNKFNLKFYTKNSKNKPDKNTKFNYIHLNFLLFHVHVEWGARSKYALAHELGHAIEFYSRGGTGQLARFHETNIELMNDMVRAVLTGLSHSWFHNNTPEPIEPPKEPKENMFKWVNNWRESSYRRKLARHEKKLFRQKQWNYAELFAEMFALYMLRPDWLKRHHPEAAELMRKLIHESPMAKHLMIN